MSDFINGVSCVATAAYFVGWEFKFNLSWGSRPRLYALARSAGLQLIVTRIADVLVAFFLALVCATTIHALGQKRYVEFTSSPGAIRLSGNGVAAPIIIDSQDCPDGVRILKSQHNLLKPAYHVLKFWVIDPGLVLEKLVVDTGGIKPSYLGPPESFRRAHLSAQ